MTRYRRFGREFAIVVVGQVTSFFGAILAVRLLTHAMTPTEYGTLALALTLVTLSHQLAFSPSFGAAGRFYAVAAESGRLSAFIRSLTLLWCGGAAVTGLFLIVLIPWLSEQKTVFFLTLLPASGLILIGALNSIFSSIQSAARQRTVVATHDASGQWLRGILAWLSVSSFSSTATSALWGQLAAGAVVLASQGVFLVRLLRKRLALMAKDVAAEGTITSALMWRFAWPYSVWGCLYWCGIASERWALEAFHGPRTVGIYQAAYQIGYSPLAFCLSAILAFVSPILFEKVGDGFDAVKVAEAHRLTMALTSCTIAVTLVLAAISHLIGPFLYRFIAGQAYLDGVTLVPLALLSAGLFSAAQFISLDYLNARQSTRLIYPKVISSAFAAVSAWAGAKWGGPKGVFIGSIVANCVYLILTWGLSPTRLADRRRVHCGPPSVCVGKANPSRITRI